MTTHKKIMQHMHGTIPNLFDIWANPFDHLLLLGKELHDAATDLNFKVTQSASNSNLFSSKKFVSCGLMFSFFSKTCNLKNYSVSFLCFCQKISCRVNWKKKWKRYRQNRKKILLNYSKACSIEKMFLVKSTTDNFPLPHSTISWVVF